MLGKGFFDKHFNIIYCVWEQSEFPDDWIPAFELVDEVWTPSTFCAEVIGHRIDKPVIPIPHNVEPVAAANLDREALGLPKEAFLFLGMLDCYSTPERKNPLASLEAYVRASSESSRESYFVLKVLNSHAGKELLLSVQRYQARCPRILVIDKYLSRRAVSGLMQACDCFVSLHRCEGFGLTIAEAMCLGKPVIATGWSGNMDFMNEENSLPVRYELVELKHNIGPYRKGYFWAEPDVDHAAKLMRRVMDCPGIADSIGKRGREKIKSDLSASKTGHLMRQRLQEIGLVFSADRLDSRDPLIGNQDCSS
ncbi:MAG: glycosyltransferase family 4 protein [Desulfomonile tiedjei]|nr:glycosyltransferase family 4 protein [Desulfomonile tiedjei]